MNPRTGTVLAFDFGEKHTGVAVGESSLGVAHPLQLIAAEKSAARMDEIAAFIAKLSETPPQVVKRVEQILSNFQNAN